MVRRKSRLTARTLPLLRDDIYETLAIIGAYEDQRQDDEAPAVHDWELFGIQMRTIRDAQLWWVSPDMTAVVRAAYPDVPMEGKISDYTPALGGVLIWEGGLGIESVSEEGEVVPVVGAWWHFVDLDAPAGSIIPLVRDPDSAQGVAPHLSKEGNRDLEVILMKALITTWLLSDQPTVATRTTERSDVRRAWVPKQQATPSEITVATLRRINRDSDESTTSGGERGPYSHRFLVRGHWRNQVCGPRRTMRKPTWVVPYVKGPEDAPFQAKDKINVWRR